VEALISDNSKKEGNFDTSSQSKTRAARQKHDNLPTTGVPDAGTCQCDSEVALNLLANDPTLSSLRKFELHLARLNRIYQSLEHNETALLLSLPHLRSVIDTIEGVAYQGPSSTTESSRIPSTWKMISHCSISGARLWTEKLLHKENNLRKHGKEADMISTASENLRLSPVSPSSRIVIS